MPAPLVLPAPSPPTPTTTQGSTFNPKIYRHREYQLQGDRAKAMKKLLAEFIERGWIELSDSEWASPAFLVPKKEKGEWRLVVDYRGLNEQT